MRDLVAGILRAMGYKARVSPLGPDGGHDIFASPDGLGVEEPRIFKEPVVVDDAARLHAAVLAGAFRGELVERQSDAAPDVLSASP